jgi:hypothetical protein
MLKERGEEKARGVFHPKCGKQEKKGKFPPFFAFFFSST